MTLPGYQAVVDISNLVNPLGKAQLLGQGLREVMETMNPPTTDYYADPTNGSDSNDGLTWVQPTATLQQCMDLATARGVERGRLRVFAAPGGYAEAVTTPTNAIAPFGQLIAWNPTPGGAFGGAWIQSPTALTPALTIQARGWHVQGFEIAAVANTPAILLSGTAGGNTAQGTELRDCLITGWGTAGSIGINAIYNGAPYTKLINCRFDGLLGSAITCTESGHDNPRWWEILGCAFRDNANHIDLVAKGADEFIIEGCHFMKVGANRTATLMIALTAGANNHIGPNNFLGGDYDISSGYIPGTNDFWRGNHSQDSENGSAQANPA